MSILHPHEFLPMPLTSKQTPGAQGEVWLGVNVESEGAEGEKQIRQLDRESDDVLNKKPKDSNRRHCESVPEPHPFPTYHHCSYPRKVPGRQHILKDMVIITAVLPGVCFRVLVDKLQWNVLFTNQIYQNERIKNKYMHVLQLGFLNMSVYTVTLLPYLESWPWKHLNFVANFRFILHETKSAKVMCLVKNKKGPKLRV